MTTKALLVLLLAGAAACGRSSSAPSELPEDVKQFKESRDRCDHFRGEVGYDAERREFLLQQMKTYCIGSDAALRKLRLKYQANSAVLESLKPYEDRIE